MKQEDLEAVETSLERTGSTIDTQELRLILTSYEHVDVVLEAHRFASTWSSGPLRSLLPFERWLRKAGPKSTPAGRAGDSAALGEDEIRQRVRTYRSNITGGVVFDEKWLAPEDVDWLCSAYAEKLRNRR